MSHTVFSSTLVIALILVFLSLGNRFFLYLKDNYPNIGGGVGASITAFACIGVSLILALLITIFYHWLAHVKNN